MVVVAIVFVAATIALAAASTDVWSKISILILNGFLRLFVFFLFSRLFIYSFIYLFISNIFILEMVFSFS